MFGVVLLATALLAGVLFVTVQTWLKERDSFDTIITFIMGTIGVSLFSAAVLGLAFLWQVS